MRGVDAVGEDVPEENGYEAQPCVPGVEAPLLEDRGETLQEREDECVGEAG